MKRIAMGAGVGLFLLFLYFTALPGDLAVGPLSDEGIAGVYTVNGVDPTGREYSGTATIVPIDDNRSLSPTFDVEWIITGSIQQGTGTFDGDQFVVDWTTTAAAGEGSGRTTFTVADDGRLIGQRVVEGLDGVGTEELFPEA